MFRLCDDPAIDITSHALEDLRSFSSRAHSKLGEPFVVVLTCIETWSPPPGVEVPSPLDYLSLEPYQRAMNDLPGVEHDFRVDVSAQPVRLLPEAEHPRVTGINGMAILLHEASFKENAPLGRVTIDLDKAQRRLCVLTQTM